MLLSVVVVLLSSVDLEFCSHSCLRGQYRASDKIPRLPGLQLNLFAELLPDKSVPDDLGQSGSVSLTQVPVDLCSFLNETLHTNPPAHTPNLLP